MIGFSLGLFDEEKEVAFEFVSITSVESTRSEALMNKVQEILLNNIDLSNITFSCLDGKNVMFGERIGLQRRIRNVTSFSIYVNCRCNCLASCLKHLFDQFP